MTPALRPGGLRRLDDFQTRRDVDAEIGRLLDVERLLLGLHDVRKRRVARLVETQVRRHDRRHVELDRLETAVDLAGDHDRAAVDRDLGGERALRPAEQCGEHLAGLVAVVVDGLFAENDEAGALRVDDGLQKLGDGERFDDFVAGFDEDAAVGAHRERGADRLLRFRRSDRDRDDLGDGALFLEADGFFDGDLVERVHRHLDVGKLDARAVGLDSDLDVVVDDPFDGHQHFH